MSHTGVAIVTPELALKCNSDTWQSPSSGRQAGRQEIPSRNRLSKLTVVAQFAIRITGVKCEGYSRDLLAVRLCMPGECSVSCIVFCSRAQQLYIRWHML